MTKVFFEKCELDFYKPNEEIISLQYPTLLLADFKNAEKLERFLRQSKRKNYIVIAEDAEKSFINLGYKLVIAGGGVVYNNLNEVACIFRNGKWDFPKGKLEIGEEISSCALREVKEEVGIKNLQIEEFIGVTYHVYETKKYYALKKSFWYNMKSTDKGELQPQKEEGITKAKWLNASQMKIRYDENAYSSIKYLINNML